VLYTRQDYVIVDNSSGRLCFSLDPLTKLARLRRAAPNDPIGSFAFLANGARKANAYLSLPVAKDKSDPLVISIYSLLPIAKEDPIFVCLFGNTGKKSTI